jgi:hypothetical protein
VKTVSKVRRRLSLILFLAGVLAGLAAAIHALRSTFVREKHLAAVVAVEPLWIRAALVAGIAALLLAAWLRLRKARDESQWAALRLLFEVLVAGAIAYAAFSRPFNKTTFDVGLGLAPGVWGLALAAASAVRAGRIRRAFGAAEVVVFNLCLFVLLAEAGLRLAASWSSSPLLEQALDRPSMVIRKKREDWRPGRLRFGFPLNAGSYYDTELRPGPPGRTVAMIGDSFSYGILPHHMHFTTVCERKLKAEVYNFGFPGIGPAEYLHLLETEVGPLAPAVIAVNLFVGNDVGDAKVRGLRNPKMRAWFDLDNLLVCQLPFRLWRLGNERRHRGGNEPVGELAGEAAERRLESVEEMIEAYPWLGDPALEEGTLLAKTHFEVERKRALWVCDPARKDFSALFSFLLDMRAAAGDTPFVVQILPDEFQLDDDLWRRIERSAAKRGLVRDQPQEVLGAWLGREEIPYLDLLGELRNRCATASGGQRHCYHLRDTHFNRRGNLVAGEAMAAFLRRHLPRSAEEPPNGSVWGR